MTTIRKLMVELGLESSDYMTKLDSAERKAQTTASKIEGSFSKLGASLTKTGTIMSAAVTLPIAGFFYKAVEGASNIEESVNKVRVVFEGASDTVLNFAKGSADAMGMTEAAVLEAAGTYGNLFTAVGLTEDASAKMSTELITLSSDLASFNNLDPTDVLDKLRAGLTGETEPLKRLGININAATVEAKAMELGLIGLGEELTPTAKLQATYALITEQTAKAHGDFARTSDGLANTMRIVKARVGDLVAQMGKYLLPIALTVVNAIGKLVAWFGNLSPAGQKMILIIMAIAAAIGPLLVIIGTLISSIGAIAGVVAGPLMATLLPVIGIIAAIIAVVALLAAAWTNDWGGIRTTITKLWNENLAPFFETVKQWLSVFIPEAIKVLKDFWENVLWPAIQAVWNFVKTYVFPIIEFLVNLLVAVLGTALKVVAFVFAEILWPAIKAVWNFVSTYVFPLFKALSEFLSAVFGLVIRVLAGIWENVLWPALKTVWNFIKTSLQPVFETIGNWLSTKLIPVLQDVAHWFADKVAPAIDAVKDAISTVIGWIQTLIDKLNNIELPDWMTPGSPTPWEIGLKGVSRELERLSQTQLPRFKAELEYVPVGVPKGIGGLADAHSNEQNIYQLSVYTTNAPNEVLRSFEIMKAMAGR